MAFSLHPPNGTGSIQSTASLVQPTHTETPVGGSQEIPQTLKQVERVSETERTFQSVQMPEQEVRVIPVEKSPSMADLSLEAPPVKVSDIQVDGVHNFVAETPEVSVSIDGISEKYTLPGETPHESDPRERERGEIAPHPESYGEMGRESEIPPTPEAEMSPPPVIHVETQTQDAAENTVNITNNITIQQQPGQDGAAVAAEVRRILEQEMRKYSDRLLTH